MSSPSDPSLSLAAPPPEPARASARAAGPASTVAVWFTAGFALMSVVGLLLFLGFAKEGSYVFHFRRSATFLLSCVAVAGAMWVAAQFYREAAPAIRRRAAARRGLPRP